MKAPITIAVIALHLAIVATILVPGCKSSGDTELNPEVTRSQAKTTSHHKASELSRTRAAKAKTSEEISVQTVKEDDSVAILDSQPQEGSEEFRAAPMRPIATLEDEMFASDETFAAKKDSEKLAPKQSAKAAEQEGAEEKTYIVQKGDSLSKIASNHGVNLSVLMEANGLNRKSVIKVGQKLTIPAAAAQPKQQQAAQPEQNSEIVTYVVQKGDNLSKIASKYNTSVAAIMDANGMTKSSINAGKKLKIPTGSKAAAAEKKIAAAKEKDNAKKYEGKLIHTVKAGDTLGGISIKYGVAMKTLMEQNNIKDARKIRVGQILVIKDKPANAEAAFEDNKPEAAPEAKAEPEAAPQPQAPSNIPSEAVNQTTAQPQQDIPSL
ncbi:MAG: LysM peptidoglycan-binding domain-containing protein [Opitutales bacterium]|nr:LysM peptidoglycan-binding domain-containing protein [Opitutales bacterium]